MQLSIMNLTSHPEYMFSEIWRHNVWRSMETRATLSLCWPLPYVFSNSTKPVHNTITITTTLIDRTRLKVWSLSELWLFKCSSCFLLWQWRQCKWAPSRSGTRRNWHFRTFAQWALGVPHSSSPQMLTLVSLKSPFLGRSHSYNQG